jgi:hypothetical protein
LFCFALLCFRKKKKKPLSRKFYILILEFYRQVLE